MCTFFDSPSELLFVCAHCLNNGGAPQLCQFRNWISRGTSTPLNRETNLNLIENAGMFVERYTGREEHIRRWRRSTKNTRSAFFEKWNKRMKAQRAQQIHSLSRIPALVRKTILNIVSSSASSHISGGFVSDLSDDGLPSTNSSCASSVYDFGLEGHLSMRPAALFDHAHLGFIQSQRSREHFLPPMSSISSISTLFLGPSANYGENPFSGADDSLTDVDYDADTEIEGSDNEVDEEALVARNKHINASRDCRCANAYSGAGVRPCRDSLDFNREVLARKEQRRRARLADMNASKEEHERLLRGDRARAGGSRFKRLSRVFRS